ncbi:hypothetical protein ACIGO9_31375 [Nocardia asteroides]
MAVPDRADLLVDEYTDEPVEVLLRTVAVYTADAVFVPHAISTAARFPKT